MKQNNQSGRSMIEMLAVLMIIGVLTVGAVTGLSQAVDKYKAEKIHSDVQYINQEVANLYSWMRNYPSVADMNRFCNNDIFPDGCDGSNVGANPYGGQYAISFDKGQMIIQVDGLPDEVCKDLTLREWSYVAETPSCSSGTLTVKFY